MAPVTALAFMLLGFTLAAAAAAPERGAVRVAAIVVSVAVYFAVIPILIQYLSGVSWDVERGIMSSPRPFHGVPEGRMSPVTAAAFMLASLAMCLRFASHEHRRLQDVAGLMSSGVIVIGCILVLSYIYDSPLFYGRAMIPVALPTAFAFVILGVGNLLAAGPGALPARLFDISGIPPRLLVIFFLLMAGIGAVGSVFYIEHRNMFMSTVAEQLSSVADLKISQINVWRQERLSDARTISENPFIAEAIKGIERDRSNARLVRELSKWLTVRKAGYDFRDVLIMGADGHPLLAAEGTSLTVDQEVEEMARESMADGTIRLTDFHVGSAGWVHMDLLVPVIDTSSSKKAPLGVVFIRIDPNRFLYPLIQSWPTPSPTAETLLVRRDGDEVVFLNELRHRSDTTLSLRFPVSQQDLPAAMAVRGIVGVVRGRDYRGEPVVAAIMPVPDTSWFIVSKVDAHEIFTPLRQQGMLVWLAVMLAVALSGSAVVAFWRKQQARFATHEAVALRESEERFRLLYERAPLGYQSLDVDGRIREVNQAWLGALGYSKDEVIGRWFGEFLAPDQVDLFRERFPKFKVSGEIHGVEFVMQKKDGSRIIASFDGRIVYGEKENMLRTHCILTNVTEQKRAAEEIKTQLDELQRWQEVMLDREDRVQELKREVNDLCRRLGEEMRYQSEG